MSFVMALGIVAVVNLAIGYALALVIEGEHSGAHAGDTLAMPSPTMPAEATVASTVQTEPARPVAGSPVNSTAGCQGQTGTRDSGSAMALSATQGLPAGQTLPPIPPSPENQEPSAAVTPLADEIQSIGVEQPSSVEKTIVNCERLLDAAAELLREEHALQPATELAPAVIEDVVESLPPLEPRATLADAAQLEAAITSWWQNDPERTRPICVGQIEIDNLRQLTAELGAAVAGNLAKQIEARVLNVLRRDDLVASLGRARFLVLFPNADGATSAKLLDQLRSRLEATDFVQDGKIVRATLTAGVAQATADESSESFLARAADALAEARAKGRNRVAWHDGATASLVEPRRSAEASERVAI